MPSSLNTLIDTALAGWTEEQWCQGKYALDNNGEGTIATDDNAVRWCAMGRLRRTGYSYWLNEQQRIDIIKFNDTHTFAQTREMLESLKEPTNAKNQR